MIVVLFSISIGEIWKWTQSVLISSLHYDEFSSYTELNTLLGVARLRQVRGLRGKDQKHLWNISYLHLSTLFSK